VATMSTLRTTALTSIVLTACLAGGSPVAQQGTPQKNEPFEKFDHDDPVVIDNPILKAYRKSGAHGEPAYANGQWKLGEADPFTRIEITAWKNSQQGYILAFPTDATTFEFSIIEGRKLTPAFTLKREGAGRQSVYVTDEGKKKFDNDTTSTKKIKWEKSTHVGEIKIGTSTWICVATGAAPTKGRCDTNKLKPPSALKVEICGNDECSITSH
jgi:hypothetical protein